MFPWQLLWISLLDILYPVHYSFSGTLLYIYVIYIYIYVNIGVQRHERGLNTFVDLKLYIHIYNGIYII